MGIGGVMSKQGTRVSGREGGLPQPEAAIGDLRCHMSLLDVVRSRQRGIGAQGLSRCYAHGLCREPKRDST